MEIGVVFSGNNKKLSRDGYGATQKPVPPTFGHHLARRLVQICVSDIFSVPGDSNLILLDFFVDEPELNLIGCCSELNAGYAADGYARARGVGAFVVTFGVGGLSILNAVAGAYAEDVPLICIVGAPNSNEYGSNKILHHSIGLPDFSHELQCFQTVTCHQVVINSLENAREQIDEAIARCLEESKPVYISISCNLVNIPHSSFLRRPPIPLVLTTKVSNQMTLEGAVTAAAEMLNKATKPVLVAGPKLKSSKAADAFIDLSNTCAYATAVMPSAKGFVPETLQQFIGTYWGVASSPCCDGIVETADALLFAGPVFDDVSTVGDSLLFNKKKAIIAESDRVVIPGLAAFEKVMLKDFLMELAKRLDRNTSSYENYQRIYVPEGSPIQSRSKETLRVNVLFKYIEKMLSEDTALVVETGDSWFHGQKMKLPRGCGFVSQMMYASIGWSVNATLGYAQAMPNKRVIACIGDGSFQMSPQDISTMLQCRHKSIIFLINNGGYTIEVEIHDGPYNVIKNWNYTAFVNALDNGEGRCWTAKVQCEEELVIAITTAMEEKRDCLCFIEVITHRDDTSKELLQFVCRIAAANARSPNPQFPFLDRSFGDFINGKDQEYGVQRGENFLPNNKAYLPGSCSFRQRIKSKIGIQAEMPRRQKMKESRVVLPHPIATRFRSKDSISRFFFNYNSFMQRSSVIKT